MYFSKKSFESLKIFEKGRGKQNYADSYIIPEYLQHTVQKNLAGVTHLLTYNKEPNQ